VRLSSCEVRDHINYRKNDRWRSYRFYRAAAAEIANALHLRDFRSSAIFEFFNTICQEETLRSDNPYSTRSGLPLEFKGSEEFIFLFRHHVAIRVGVFNR
jgi:hypothetical protein